MNLADALRRFKEQQLAGGEAALSIGSAILAEPIAGLAGIGGAILPGPEGQGAANVDYWRDKLTYRPRDTSTLEAIGDSAPASLLASAMHSYERGKQYLGDKAQDAGASPALATAAFMAPDLLMAAASLPSSAYRAAALNAEGGAGGFAGSRQLGAVGDDVGRQRFTETFGKKGDRAAKLAKKVSKQAKADAGERQSVGKREKVDPAKFRKMEQALGREATLAAIRRGEHLRPDGYGGYVGAPRTVDSPQALGALRKDLSEQFSDAVSAVEHADPTRVGTWYDRAKRGMSQSTDPGILDNVLDEHAIYSAGVSPESELAFALKHRNSRAAGQRDMAFRRAGMNALDTAHDAGERAKMGFKIGEYRAKNDPRIPNEGLFGVNDFRAAQGMHYTQPSGDIWLGGASDTMHPFMDAETALIGERANAAGVGGRTDWQGPHIQEMPWILGKAQDLYSRGKNARYKGDPAEGMKLAIIDANKTAEDFFYKHAGSSTYEYTPGANSGHAAAVLDMTPEQKMAYGEQGRWDVNGNRDALYSAVGMRQLPSLQSSGLYTNSAGVTEFNPMTIARPLVDFPTGGGGGMATPQTIDLVKAMERFRGANDAQEAVAFNLPNTMASVKGKDALVLDTRGAFPEDVAAGVQPTSDQLSALASLVQDSGYMPTATNRGALLFNPMDGDPKALAAMMKKYKNQIQEIFPSTPDKAKVTSFYEEIPQEPFSGKATTAVLEGFMPYQGAAEKIAASPDVRNSILGKVSRDANIPGAREDIQNMRRFLATEDWPKAVAMMRAGMKPAAALAALGYSMGAMASEDGGTQSR